MGSGWSLLAASLLPALSAGRAVIAYLRARHRERAAKIAALLPPVDEDSR